MGNIPCYSMAKKKSYSTPIPDDSSTLLKDIPGFNEFKDYIYIVVTNVGAIKMPLTATWEQFQMAWYYYIFDLNNEIVLVGDVIDDSPSFYYLLPLIIISAFFLLQFKFIESFAVAFVIVLLISLWPKSKTAPDTFITWEALMELFQQLMTLSEFSMSSQLKSLSRYAAGLKNSNPLRMRFGSSSETIPGTSNTVVDYNLEMLTISPFTTLPFHSHSSVVYALALTEGMEFTVNGGQVWKMWKKGEIVLIPKNIQHSVRNTTSEEVQLLSGCNGPHSAINDFH